MTMPTDAHHTEIRIQAAIQANRDDMNRLRGKLFTVIEAMGLFQAQEDAAKRLIRNVTYDAQSDIEAALRGGR